MSKRILIVEDEKNIVDILSFNLGREGYDTLEAYDGETGLKLALEENPDLILLDLMLPKMDGFDVCRAVREKNRSTPIIMLTAGPRCLPSSPQPPPRAADNGWSGEGSLSTRPC